MLAIIYPRVRGFGSIIGKELSTLIIYKATNLINNKIYIGQTINTLEYRKNQHFREARCEKKNNNYFHNAINKYGCENFIFEEIDFANSQEELDEKERFWINHYDSTDKSNGYNLDSGGRGGGAKSEETKHKIGLTTLEKWKNPEIAEKMRQGLLKGAETMKRNAKQYPFTCPICNKTYYYERYIAESKKYCSNECTTKSGSWKIGVESSAKANHERNLDRKKIIKNDIIDWILNNEETVLNCPYNKIETTLYELKNMLLKKHNIKDIRSIYICFDGVKNKKTLLDRLKEIIYISKENVC